MYTPYPEWSLHTLLSNFQPEFKILFWMSYGVLKLFKKSISRLSLSQNAKWQWLWYWDGILLRQKLASIHCGADLVDTLEEGKLTKQFHGQPDRYMDFNIPWSMLLSTLRQTIKFICWNMSITNAQSSNLNTNPTPQSASDLSTHKSKSNSFSESGQDCKYTLLHTTRTRFNPIEDSLLVCFKSRINIGVERMFTILPVLNFKTLSSNSTFQLK